MKHLTLQKLILLTLVVLVVDQKLLLTSATIGINYGLHGDNLPPPSDVVNLYKKLGITYMRLFEPVPSVFDALRGSGIKVAVGPLNADLTSMASSVDAAAAWLSAHIIPYKNDVDFGWLVLGNELVPGDLAQQIAPAMNNIQSALSSAGLSNVKVSTAIHAVALTTLSPPSTAAFTNEPSQAMNNILSFLSRTNNPLFINAYPYWTYHLDPSHIDLGYATFNTSKPVMDGNLKYYSLFEATVDAFYAAMEKSNAGNVGLVIGESGWPNGGDPPVATKEIAQRYNQNLINLVKHKGTPRKPDARLDTFIFAMFNEDLKTPYEVEKYWGIYYPSMEPVYPLTF